MTKKRIAIGFFVALMLSLTLIPTVSAYHGDVYRFDISKDFSTSGNTVDYLEIDFEWILGGITEADYMKGGLSCPQLFETRNGKIDLVITNTSGNTVDNLDENFKKINGNGYYGKGLHGKLWKKSKFCTGTFTGHNYNSFQYSGL